MEHFAEHIWVDFVRGLATADTTHEIHAHLAAGCADCTSSSNLWSRVGSFADREREYAPPTDLLRLAKLGLTWNASRESEAGTLATLIFDSATQPLPMGIRSGTVDSQQMVYEAAGVTVDLRIERRPHSKTICVWGQVLDKHAPLAWLGNANIVLWADKGQLLARAEANDRGEFQFEFEPQDKLHVSIVTVGRPTVRITLGNIG